MALSNISSPSNTVDSINNVAKALKFAMPFLAYCNYGRQDAIAERNGQQVKWYQHAAASIVTATLDEEPTFSASAHTVTTVTANMELRGDGKGITELLDVYSVFDLRQDLAVWAGESAGKSLNWVTQTVLTAGTPTAQYIYPTGKTVSTMGTADTATLDYFMDATRKLRDADAPTFDIGGTPCFVAIVSPSVKTQLMKTSAFREAVRYNGTERLFAGHLGTFDGLCFVESSTANNITANTTAAITADQSLVFGNGAYGVTSLPLLGKKGMVPEQSGVSVDSGNLIANGAKLEELFRIVITQPGDGNGGGAHGDEYAMKYKITWKALYKCVILNSTWIYNVRTARAS